MKLFFGYASSLEYWRAHPTDPPPDRRSRAHTLNNCATNAGSVAPFECERLGIATTPLHVLAPSDKAKHSSSRIACHVQTAPLPVGSFVNVGKNLFASSPELTFFQFAQSGTSIATLVAIGDELCGCYRISKSASEGFVDALPLTTAAKLRAFAERMGSARGARRAREAARFVANRSASPRETDCCELLCLPRARGGYGLELARMNGEVRVAANGSAGARRTLHCDLYWPKHRLAIEYESDLHHRSGKAIARDSKRRTSLGSEGVFVVTVTNEQITSVRDFDAVAHLLAKRMGVRLRIRSDEFRIRQIKLRTELFSRYRDTT